MVVSVRVRKTPQSSGEKTPREKKLSVVKEKGHPRIESPARTGAKSTFTSQDTCVISL